MFLGHEHQYNRSFRNIIVAFGSIFKDLEMVSYDKDTREELRRITVPLSYASKETYIQRLDGDPDLTKGTQVLLPAMTYEMTGITFDRGRQISNFMNNQISQDSELGSGTRLGIGIPYNLDFELNLYVRNQEDGFQIIEQILPAFTPQYTMGIKYLTTADSCSIVNDLPIILDKVIYDTSYEGTQGDVRYIHWTLNFVIQALLYGPTDSGSSIIKEVDINWIDQQVSTIVSANGVNIDVTLETP